MPTAGSECGWLSHALPYGLIGKRDACPACYTVISRAW